MNAKRLVFQLFFAWLACGASHLLAATPAPAYADVSYGPNPHQIMDLYLPAKSGQPAPVLLWFGGIWKPSKHVPDLKRFLPANIAVIGVETRTITDGIEEAANPPVSYVLNDACRAVQFFRLTLKNTASTRGGSLSEAVRKARFQRCMSAAPASGPIPRQAMPSAGSRRK